MPTCVAIATKGRPETLRATLSALGHQTSKPISVIVSCVTDEDVGRGPLPDGVNVVTGSPGSSVQRNRAISAAPDGADVIAFLDDDFVPHARWIEAVESEFASEPRVVCVTGNVLADGIKGPGLTFAEACEILERAGAGPLPTWRRLGYSPYGCNMAARRSAMDGVAFDERLVLYGWQEDRDFGAQLARRGDIVKIGSALGVHLGVKRGRVSGRKFGYSQVANPAYLYRKGTMTLDAAVRHVGKNFAANLARSCWPEPYVDRAGRLRGNLLGLWDAARGRADPEKAMVL